ncbi:MAG: NAD(P)H-dependent glycerol-3-phosphate dehydrogenase [Candidatus Eisenbacteria bacterium]|nr:NAD(P)H-dependent glycerol-3-phosphate dehydrogenase [Candidatus Eisenbacteria bacterium]
MTGPTAILGGGSWGTALSILLAGRGAPVRLWAFEAEEAQRMEAERENATFLPGFRFPPTLHVMYRIEEALEEAEAIVLAVPSTVLRGVVEQIDPARVTGRDVVVATKGLEEESGKRMSEVVRERLPEAPIAVLAGPSLAREVAAGLPASVLSASADPACAARVRERFHGPFFRVYESSDVAGVEVGTALKNVIALAAGIADGMKLGENAKGALLTRGLAEITRLGVALGARRETFLGLAGVGDLVTTCSSPLSRNRSLGEMLGRGIPFREAAARMTQVAEGVPTTRSAWRLSRRLSIEMPITEQVHQVLFEGLDPVAGLRALMGRPPRAEGEEG